MSQISRLATGVAGTTWNIQDAANAFTDISDSAYATVTGDGNMDKPRFTGFDFSAIPTGSTVNWVQLYVSAQSFSNEEYTNGGGSVRLRINNVERGYMLSWEYYASGLGNRTTQSTQQITGITLADLKASTLLNSVWVYASYAYEGNLRIYGMRVVVDYSLPTKTISASAGPGGTISPSGSVIVTQGSNKTFTITPNAGYLIAALTVNGSAVTPASTYTFTNVQQNHTIRADFKRDFDPAIGAAKIRDWNFR